MTTTIQILIPIISRDVKKIYFKGYIDYFRTNEVTISITKFSENEMIAEKRNNETDTIYGYCDYLHQGSYPHGKYTKKIDNFISLYNNNGKLFVNKLLIKGKKIETQNKCLIVIYDYDRIRDSEVEWEYSDNLSKLHHLVQTENNLTTNNNQTDETPFKCPSWLSSSMFILHIINYINLVSWFIKCIQKNKKICIKQGNLILAIAMDILLGYIALQYLTQDKSELSSSLMGLLEKLINMLYSLLKWLMGAPAGLKLNNAFNKMLGKYFSYHVQLWWLFLDVSGEKLDVILHIYSYLGYLGFTFQAAVISDMICIATFHSYCIYVYAARMFNIQVSGLIALLRFFVGRKYNPLRGTIDSCEYTNQELFVGTVAFTILLLLLPTTVMYYTVFTVFRVLSLLVQYALAKVIHFVHTLPFYVTVLWLVRSPKVAGNVLLEVTNQEAEVKDEPLTIRLKLLNKSIFYLVKNFRPPVEVPKTLVWKDFLSNVFIGKQIL